VCDVGAITANGALLRLTDNNTRHVFSVPRRRSYRAVIGMGCAVFANAPSSAVSREDRLLLLALLFGKFRAWQCPASPCVRVGPFGMLQLRAHQRRTSIIEERRTASPYVLRVYPTRVAVTEKTATPFPNVAHPLIQSTAPCIRRHGAPSQTDGACRGGRLMLAVPRTAAHCRGVQQRPRLQVRCWRVWVCAQLRRRPIGHGLARISQKGT
jgi:hypothetical protein